MSSPAVRLLDLLWDRYASEVPSARTLLELEKESQYGAWLLAFGRKVNHFTGSVDDVAGGMAVTKPGRLTLSQCPTQGHCKEQGHEARDNR